VDLDRQIQLTSGKTIAEIFAEIGEVGFRRLESEALADAVKLPAAVISLGGGTILSETNRELICQHGRCVFLTALVSTIVDRLVSDLETGQNRPSLTGLPMAEEIQHVLTQRLPLYQAVADFTVETDHLVASEVTERIMKWLKK
jgi:shikimate kinase